MNFEVLADQALVGLLLFDKATNKCIYTNHMAREVLFLQKNNLDFNLNEIFPIENRNPRFKCLTQELIEHEGLYQEVIIQRPGSNYFIGQIGVKHINTDSYDHVLLMIQDMTVQAKLQREIETKQSHLKLAYEDLLKQNQELKELDIAKTRFIALITHELRTPTSGIVATSEMLKLGIYDTEAQLKEFIGMIHSEGKLLLELINDILDFAKIQSGKMDYYLESSDLNKLVQEVVEPLKKSAEAAGIKIINEIDTEAFCYFDSLRMHQVVNNLLSNGIKYNKPTGLVTLRIEKQNDKIRLIIIDTGKGIANENQSKIFNEFETLGKLSNHTKGTGLGLPIAKRMIEAMGGAIGFESIEGKGSTFWVDIPTTQVLEDSESYRERPAA